MQIASNLAMAATPVTSTTPQTIDRKSVQDPWNPADRVDHQFMGMLDSYRASGGLARVQEVFTIHKSKHGGDYACLARSIVKRELLSFDWQSHVWIPLFQFDRTNMTRLPGLAAVLETLNPDYTAWSLAMWFARPNAWLREHSPASILGTDAAAVLTAARARHLSST